MTEIEKIEKGFFCKTFNVETGKEEIIVYTDKQVDDCINHVAEKITPTKEELLAKLLEIQSQLENL